MQRRVFLTLTVAAAMNLAAASGVHAQPTISIAGAPTLMQINSAVAGSEPVGITGRAGGTYTITTPAPNRTYAITAQLNANMPTGTTLSITLVEPTATSTSLGAVVLDVTARNVVTGIGRNVNATRNITYDFAATAAAGVVPFSSRTVTLTVIRFP